MVFPLSFILGICFAFVEGEGSVNRIKWKFANRSGSFKDAWNYKKFTLVTK